MKNKLFFIIFLLIPALTISAQAQSISSILNHFSPLAEIIVRNLGMEDKNSNGIVDKNAGEGYEEFIERCGIGDTFEEKERSIDRGFHANGIIIGANNGRLEEPEIVNHYYINIRFKPVFAEEERAIEEEITAYIRANNLLLVWLDDEHGTVMRAVTRVLGEGWNNPAVVRSENEAVRMFNRAVSGMRIAGRTGDPDRNGGYYSLPEMVNRRAGYCFEAAQFGFWFFSQLRINSIITSAFLASDVKHAVIELTSNKRKIDYFQGSSGYSITPDLWHIENPIQSISIYYGMFGDSIRNSENANHLYEQSAIYYKYDIANIGFLMRAYERRSYGNAEEIIALGEFIIQNIDMDKLMNTDNYFTRESKKNLRVALRVLRRAYTIVNKHTDYERIHDLIIRYF